METTNNSEVGGLIVQTVTAGGSFPLEGATVTISDRSVEPERNLYVLQTDRSGSTVRVALPTPPKENSLSYGIPDAYALYYVEASKNGYYPVKAEQVPVFAGTTSIQRFEMIPIAANVQQISPPDTEINERNPAPQL